MMKDRIGKHKLKPDLYYSALWNIDFEELAKRGVENLIIDVDSTIAHNDSWEIDDRARKAILGILAGGKIKNACLVSNIATGQKREQRVAKMAAELSIPYVAARLFHLKPNPKPFLLGLKCMNAQPENTAVIGDQIFTDIIGGNRLGMVTILVKPLGKVHWSTIFTFKRYREKKILQKFGMELAD
ncbi:MAG: HAD hydrolase-like protein [Firmicutes bacterium]|nr:HAD hydrolase-like protein [Bacillota bacterium]